MPAKFSQTIPFNTTIPFWLPMLKMEMHTQIADITFTPFNGGEITGGRTEVSILVDPDFDIDTSAFKTTSNAGEIEPYVLNVFIFEYNGTDWILSRIYHNVEDELSIPAITVQPEGGHVATGEALNLSVTATGNGLSYQWKKDGVNISGATSSTYTIPVTTTDDSATYTVVVSNILGTVTSDGAAITVSDEIMIESLNDLPGYVADFDFSTATNSGGKVASITDSVNGVVSSNGDGGTQPDYFATGGVNNVPYARFDGNQKLEGALLTSSSEYTMIAVRRRLGSSGSPMTYFGNGNSASNGYSLQDGNNGYFGSFHFNMTGVDGWQNIIDNKWEVVGACSTNAHTLPNKTFNTLGIDMIHEPLATGFIVPTTKHVIGRVHASLPVSHDIQRLILFDTALTQAQIKAACKFITDEINMPLPDLIVCEGDSIVARQTIPTYPFRLRDDLQSSYDILVHDTAASGSVVDQVRGRIVADPDVANPFPLTMPSGILTMFDSRVKNIITIQIGHNDIGASTPLATMKTALQEACDLLNSQGWYIILCTTLASNWNGSHDVAMDAKLTSWNDWIRTEGVGGTLDATAVCDMYAIPEALDADDTTYYTDGTHPTAALQEIMKDTLKPYITDILNS